MLYAVIKRKLLFLVVLILATLVVAALVSSRLRGHGSAWRLELVRRIVVTNTTYLDSMLCGCDFVLSSSANEVSVISLKGSCSNRLNVSAVNVIGCCKGLGLMFLWSWYGVNKSGAVYVMDFSNCSTSGPVLTGNFSDIAVSSTDRELLFFVVNSSGVYSYRLEGMEAVLAGYKPLELRCDRVEARVVGNDLLVIDCLEAQDGYTVYFLDARSLEILWSIPLRGSPLRLLRVVADSNAVYTIWVEVGTVSRAARGAEPYMVYNVTVYSRNGRVLGSSVFNLSGFVYAGPLVLARNGEALFTLISHRGDGDFVLEVYTVSRDAHVRLIASEKISASLLAPPFIVLASSKCGVYNETLLIAVVLAPIEPDIGLPVQVYMYALKPG